MRIDKSKSLQFASLQGESAQKFLKVDSLSDMQTIIYLREGVQFQRSRAILMILMDLGGTWKIMRIFLFVPVRIRDLFYRIVAKYRYRVFGRRDTCRLPTNDEKDRLLF